MKTEKECSVGVEIPCSNSSMATYSLYDTEYGAVLKAWLLEPDFLGWGSYLASLCIGFPYGKWV